MAVSILDHGRRGQRPRSRKDKEAGSPWSPQEEPAPRPLVLPWEAVLDSTLQAVGTQSVSLVSRCVMIVKPLPRFLCLAPTSCQRPWKRMAEGLLMGSFRHGPGGLSVAPVFSPTCGPGSRGQCGHKASAPKGKLWHPSQAHR